VTGRQSRRFDRLLNRVGACLQAISSLRLSQGILPPTKTRRQTPPGDPARTRLQIDPHPLVLLALSLSKGWHDRVSYDDVRYLRALRQRRSPLALTLHLAA